MASDNPIDGRCNAQTRDGGYCSQYPVTDDDGEPRNGRCRMHGGTKKSGTESPSYKHGGYTQVLDLDDEEESVYDDIAGTFADGDLGDQRKIVAEAAAEMWIRFQRSGDETFMREFRMLAERFNLAPNSDSIEHHHEGSIEAAFMADLRDSAEDDG